MANPEYTSKFATNIKGMENSLVEYVNCNKSIQADFDMPDL